MMLIELISSIKRYFIPIFIQGYDVSRIVYVSIFIQIVSGNVVKIINGTHRIPGLSHY